MVNSLPINPKAIVVSTLPTITPCKKKGFTANRF